MLPWKAISYGYTIKIWTINRLGGIKMRGKPISGSLLITHHHTTHSTIWDVVSIEVTRIKTSTITDWPEGCYWTGDPLPSTKTTVSVTW